MSVATDITNDEKIEESREGSAISGWGSGGCTQNPFWGGGGGRVNLGAPSKPPTECLSSEKFPMPVATDTTNNEKNRRV